MPRAPSPSNARARRQGRKGSPPPHRVLFVDVGNSTLAPMAKAFARHYGLHADSAGTMPAHEVSQAAVLALEERDIPCDSEAPSRLDFLRLADYERIIAIGEGVAATSPDLHAHEEWRIEDPVNLGFPAYRQARDALEARVRDLAREILDWSQPRPEDGLQAPVA